MRIGKAGVAMLVVMAVFAVITWAVGLGVMPLFTKDPAVRWAVAPAAGVAAAALAALWGYGYATDGDSEPEQAAHQPAQLERKPSALISQDVIANGPGSTAQGALFGNNIHYHAAGPTTEPPTRAPESGDADGVARPS